MGRLIDWTFRVELGKSMARFWLVLAPIWIALIILAVTFLTWTASTFGGWAFLIGLAIVLAPFYNWLLRD